MNLKIFNFQKVIEFKFINCFDMSLEGILNSFRENLGEMVFELSL